MPSASTLTKENEALERKVDSKDAKLDRIMRRGMFVGGVIGGAALGAMLDLRFGTIWGFKPSSLISAVGIGLVMTDNISRKQEDTVLALALGMAAKPVYDKTVETFRQGILGGFFDPQGDGTGD